MESTWTNPPDLQLKESHLTYGREGVHVGVLATVDPARGVWVLHADQQGEIPLPARSTVQLSPADEGRRVLLVFEHDDPDRPIIIGRILDEPVVPEPPVNAPLNKESVQGVTADGKRICMEAHEEIVLRCGKSSVVLRESGEIFIKGMKIVSRARGTHKVKGATVQIN